MNGEFGELFNKLKTEFEVLKGINHERWNNHNGRAKELQTKVNKIDARLDKLQCNTHVERMKGMAGQLRLLWSILGLWVAKNIYVFLNK